jgi:hypothetical protein
LSDHKHTRLIKLQHSAGRLHRNLTEWLPALGRWFLRALSPIAQISIVLAALTFFQQQDPLVAVHVNHQTKTISFHNNSIIPVSINSYVVAFNLHFNDDAAGHKLMDREKSIESFTTRGAFPEIFLWPLMTRSIDFTKTPLEFEDWHGQFPDDVIYCIAFEKSSWLGKTSEDAVLTPKVKFSASAFGPMDITSGMGGGYATTATLFAIEKQIKEGCLALYDKAH